MTVVYLLFVEDPWDEYYEEKFHSGFLNLKEAEDFANSEERGDWTIFEVPVGPHHPQPGQRYPTYNRVSKKAKT